MDYLAPVGGSGLLWFLLVLVLLLVVGGWVLLARAAFLDGGDMDRPNRVAQLYGYTVCLIAVIVFLISANSLVDNMFDLANPLASQAAQFGPGGSVTSFEAYRATADRDRPVAGPPGAVAAHDTISESELRSRYEALRADRLASVRFQASRDLTTSALLLVLAIILFVTHWRWLRSRAEDVVVPGARTGDAG